MLFVKEAFDTNWIAPVGPHIQMFEEELKAFYGKGFCVALSSGTAAIHLALILAGVQSGDEVICSSFTFAGSCNPIVYLNATPVFVDSEPQTWNMDPMLLEEAIKDRVKKKGKKPKAIIVVHLYGMPARMREIAAVADFYDIPVIEDAAEALGSFYFGQPVGALGEMGVLSFNGNKIITTSGGGALITRDENSSKRAKFLATQARDPAPHYEHSQIGYNYRMSNVCAAIGRGQLTVLSERVKKRRKIFEVYKGALKRMVGYQEEPEGFVSNRWLSVIYTKYASAIYQVLLEQQIESRPVWKPMHLQPVFSGCPAYVSGVSEDIFKNGLCLPSGSSLTDDEQGEIIDLIKRVF